MRMLILFFAFSLHQLHAQNTNSEGVDIQDAQFAGGQEQLAAFFAQHLNYPAAAAARHLEGAVTITFTVDSAGAVRNAKIRKGLGSGCDEEALRLAELMPKWQPALLNGKPVATGKTLQIDFRMTRQAETVKPDARKTIVEKTGFVH